MLARKRKLISMRASRVVLLAAFPLALIFNVSGIAAQTPPMPPNYAGVQIHIPGVYVTPVPNAPFSADVTILSHQKLTDGTEVIRTTINHIARDAQGRIYNERRALVPTTFRGEPPLTEAHIFDPNTRLNTFYVPASHVARQTTLSPAAVARQVAAPPPIPGIGGIPRPGQPSITQTDLGEQLIDSTTLRGTEKQRTIPASGSGTGLPVTITDEYWYAPDLFVYLIVKHDDPRTGEQIVAVSHIDRHEPPAQRFEVPTGFKIVDETPPPATPAAP
jgi:hypothetical protein